MEERYSVWQRGEAREATFVFAVEAADAGSLAVESPAVSCEIIGELTVTFGGHPGVGDLGYWISQRHHGRGHGGRVVRLAVAAAFERLGAHAVTASVKEGNDASLAALDRSGFVRERAPKGTEIAWIASLTRRRWLRGQGLVEAKEGAAGGGSESRGGVPDGTDRDLHRAVILPWDSDSESP